MKKDSVYRQSPKSLFLKGIVYLAAGITVGVFLLLIGYVFFRGLPHLSLDMFSLHYTSENSSLLPALFNTIIITSIALAIAVPMGVFSAVYLTEYAPRGSRLVKLIRIAAETLSGIPSIVYGLFGMLFFVTSLGWGFSILSGAFTLSIMILPLIMRTTEEALATVPDSYREGSFGLGAGKLRTVFRIVLPSAIPGIMSGIILAVGRIIGETAALIYTAGTVAEIPTNLMSSGRTLAVHMYALSNEGLHMDKAFATGVVLVVMVFGINILSARFAKKIGDRTSEE